MTVIDNLATDEAKFALHDNSMEQVTRKPGERYNSFLVPPFYPLGRGSILVRDGIS